MDKNNLTAREQMQANMIGAVTVSLIAILVFVGGFFAYRHFHESQIAQEQLTEQSQAAYKQLQSIKNQPAHATNKAGFKISHKGYKADNKLQTVSVYMEPLCPGCANLERQLGPTLRKLVDNGRINLEIHPMTFQDNKSSDEYSTRVAGGMVYIIEHDPNPDHLLDFLSLIYSKSFQPGELDQYKPVSDKTLAEQAVAAGVPENIADKAFSKNTPYRDWLKTADTYTVGRTDLYAPNATGFSTPTVTINGKYWQSESFTPVNLMERLGLHDDSPAK